MKNKIIVLVMMLMTLSACDQKGSVDSTKQRAEAEQEVSRDVENKNQQEKSQKMEVDLSQRHYFYGAIEGQYQGTAQFGDLNYKIKFNIIRSVPPYSGNRTRQLSEIENDLNNLAFYIQVIQWHPDDETTAVGCRVSQIRPDMQTGIMTIASADCPNLYTLYLSDFVSASAEPRAVPNEKAKSTAEKIKNKEIKAVESLVGAIQPTSRANTFQFSVHRSQ